MTSRHGADLTQCGSAAAMSGDRRPARRTVAPRGGGELRRGDGLTDAWRHLYRSCAPSGRMSLLWRALMCALLLLVWTPGDFDAALQPVTCQFRTRLQVWNNYRRVGRYSVSRTPYDANAVATYQRCRLILAGDVELNPGPQTTTAATRRSLTVFLHNPRSLKNKLGFSPPPVRRS